VDKAWSILDRLVDEEKNHPMNDPLRMTKMTGWLNMIVNSWRKLVQRSGDPLMEAKEVLARLDRYKPCLLPDVQTYTMVVDAVTTQRRDGPGVALFAEEVLERMHCESHVNPFVLPDVITYSSVINAWAKSGLPEGPEKAEAVFRRMEGAGLKPNTNLFYHGHKCMGQ
jgi:pentatricopeptide repeat protein